MSPAQTFKYTLFFPNLMGRIKTVLVKRTTLKLLEKNPQKFGKDFERNKASVSELSDCRSKKLRNVIAGYAVRLKRKEDEPRRVRKSFSGRGFNSRRR